MSDSMTEDQLRIMLEHMTDENKRKLLEDLVAKLDWHDSLKETKAIDGRGHEWRLPISLKKH